MNNRIRLMREKRHMSQIRLSIELGVSQETVSAYENGRHYPSFNTLLKMREIFGVSIDYLMGLEEDMPDREKHLTSDEEEILFRYRRLNELQRAKVQAYLEGLGER